MLNLPLLFGESLPAGSERFKLICFVHGSDGLDRRALQNEYAKFHLPEIKNWSRDFANLKSNNETFVKNNRVFLSPTAKARIEKDYSKYIDLENKFDIGDFGNFNNLAQSEIEAAKDMSQLYFQMHLFENSVRKFMESVFFGRVG